MTQTKLSQKDKIINHIKQHGYITSLQAFKLGITQLGARIDGLKKEGYKFRTEWDSNKNAQGETKYFKRYYLVD